MFLCAITLVKYRRKVFDQGFEPGLSDLEADVQTPKLLRLILNRTHRIALYFICVIGKNGVYFQIRIQFFRQVECCLFVNIWDLACSFSLRFRWIMEAEWSSGGSSKRGLRPGRLLAVFSSNPGSEPNRKECRRNIPPRNPHEHDLDLPNARKAARHSDYVVTTCKTTELLFSTFEPSFLISKFWISKRKSSYYIGYSSRALSPFVLSERDLHYFHSMYLTSAVRVISENASGQEKTRPL